MKKKFKCKQCYSRARIIIAKCDAIWKQKTAIEVLSADLTWARDWNRTYEKLVSGLTARVRELEGDNAREIAVLTEDLTKAHELIAELESRQ